MKKALFVSTLLLFSLTSCFDLEEEPILLVNPDAVIKAHVKDQKIFATAMVNVNPQVLTAGNISTSFEFSGELAIYNTENGTIIDVNTFSGGGLSQVYTVSADTLGHERFVVVASGTVKAYADIGNDGETNNDQLISEGEFYSESQYMVSDLLAP